MIKTTGNHISMQPLMRWFGPEDAVTLDDIAQAGSIGIVSALHNIPPGEIWPVDKILAHKEKIESVGLLWKVVESLPVHENIKTAGHHCQSLIENYKKSLKNLAKCGMEVVTYNFMPVLDWVRTDTAYRLSNGSETLCFNKKDFGVFDLFLIKRAEAEKDYSPVERDEIHAHFHSMTQENQSRLYNSVLMGLPGSMDSLSTEYILNKISAYKEISRQILKKNLIHFLNEVASVAEDSGIKLAIHPDDPPFSVLGLPRVMCTDQDIEDIMSAVHNPASGLCFCTGSFGSRKDNLLPQMIQKWGQRIYFLHLRNVKHLNDGHFIEAGHLEGDVDMYAVVSEIVKLMRKEKRSIPMRPDHGFKILDDLRKKTYPGYSAIGRLKGLAELKGLEMGIIKSHI